MGYNVIRIPFSNEMVETNPVPTNFTTNAGGKPVNAALIGKAALEDLDTIVAYAGYISAAGTAPVWLGEFGTGNNAADIQNTAAGSQGQWFARWWPT